MPIPIALLARLPRPLGVGSQVILIAAKRARGLRGGGNDRHEPWCGAVRSFSRQQQILAGLRLVGRGERGQARAAGQPLSVSRVVQLIGARTNHE